MNVVKRKTKKILELLQPLFLFLIGILLIFLFKSSIDIYCEINPDIKDWQSKCFDVDGFCENKYGGECHAEYNVNGMILVCVCDGKVVTNVQLKS